MSKKLLLSFVLAGMAFLPGCSDKLPLSGTVTYSDDGTPVTAGAVFFETPTYSSQAAIKSDGTFIVGSTGLADGIPKGTYGVCIRGAENIVTVKGPGGIQTERRTALIDPKYQSLETSGLTFTVDGKSKKFDIKVDRAK